MVAVYFGLSRRVIVVEDIITSLAAQLEETVHQFVDSIDFDYQKLLVEDLIILRIHESQTFGKVRGSFKQIMIPEGCHSCLPDSLEIVHKNRSCFLGLFTVLFSEGFDSFLDLFDLRLVLDLWQVKSCDVVEEMLHFCGL